MMLSSTASAADILSTALGTAQSDMMSALGAAAPAALAIGTAVLVITVGWKLFKRMSK